VWPIMPAYPRLRIARQCVCLVRGWDNVEGFVMRAVSLTTVGCILLAVFFTPPLHGQGTMAPLPPHASLYAIFARGMWFQAPTDFTIVGLRVPEEVTTPQCLQVVRTAVAPDTGTGGQTSNF